MASCDTNLSREVFLTSPWIPPEWVKAHGLDPRAILFAPGYGCDPAPLGAGICRFAQDAVHYARLGTSPIVVFATHCDQLRRGCDSVERETSGRTFLFNLPASTRSPIAEKIFSGELVRLGKFLVRVGGRSPAPAAAARCLEDYETSRQRLRDAVDALTGRGRLQAVARFHWDGSLQLASPPADRAAGGTGDPVRLAVVGGPLRVDRPGLLRQVESAGAQVILDATEWGERSLGWPGPTESQGNSEVAARLGALLPPANVTGASSANEALGDRFEGFGEVKGESPALEILCQRFIGACVDVFQRPNRRLYSWLAERLRRRRAQGILLWHYLGCDLWRAEAQTMREEFGLPLLLLEADESGSATERQAGRIQAFVEAIE